MVDNHTGVIKINRFSNNTYTEFMKALEGMIEKDKLSHLIIDLRGNPGGYLSAATDILDQPFTDRKLLVYTNGRTNGRKEYRSTGQPFYNIDKIAVLIDELRQCQRNFGGSITRPRQRRYRRKTFLREGIGARAIRPLKRRRT